MKLTAAIKVFGAVLGRWLVRWLEMLGENPPLGRDCGIGSWHYLHLKQVREEGCTSPEGDGRGIEPVQQRRAPGEPGAEFAGVIDGEALRERDRLRAH